MWPMHMSQKSNGNFDSVIRMTKGQECQHKIRRQITSEEIVYSISWKEIADFINMQRALKNQ